MTDKAYIVANKEQEIDVLKKLERKGLIWTNGKNPTDFITSDTNLFDDFVSFPYAILEGSEVSWRNMNGLDGIEIVYDGRKEENMYKVTRDFMNELIEWRDDNNLDALQGNWQNTFRPADFKYLPDAVSNFRLEDENPIERNNRLIAIIQWLNGEDVFEVEEPRKFIVRSDKKDHDGDYAYVVVENDMTIAAYTFVNATKFYTREEAQEWANSHQVVVEIDAEGNEVE